MIPNAPGRQRIIGVAVCPAEQREFADPIAFGPPMPHVGAEHGACPRPDPAWMETRLTLKPVLTASLIVLTATAGMALPTTAQETAPVEITAESVSDTQVNAFVLAAIKLEQLRKDYTIKIANAESEEAREALTVEADKAARQTVQAIIGISPAEYLAISKAAMESEELTARINARVAELRELQEKGAQQKAQDDAAEGAGASE